MEWTIRIMYAIILTSITGSIWFGAWYVIGKILDKQGYISIMYFTLKANLIFWCFPFAFFIVEYNNNRINEGGNFLFFNTPIIKIIGWALIIAWISVVIISLMIYIYNIWVTYKSFSSAFDCNEKTKKIFYDVCNRVHIKKSRVKIKQSYMVTVPVCVGVFRPMVIIPVKDYKKDELEVIFVHELTHYKHKDVLLKHLTFIVSCFHCFNPFMYFMKRQLDIWSEYSCDYASVNVIGSVKNYFQVILNMTLEKSDRGVLYSPLFEKKSELECRIEHMQRNKKIDRKSKLIAAVCIFAMIITSTVSVWGVTLVGEKAYMDVYNSTVEEVYDTDETYSEDGLIEYEESAWDIGVVEETVAVSNDEGGLSASFSWNISNNTVNISPEIQLEEEESISVIAVCVPNIETFRIGIIEPDGVRRYVSGTNMISHVFNVRKAGTHYVYVQNMSSTTEITVNGAYAW